MCYTYDAGRLLFCMSQWLSIYDSPHKMKKCVCSWEAVSIFEGRRWHHEAMAVLLAVVPCSRAHGYC